MTVAAIILAAGMSTRMGVNKLLQQIEGEPLIHRVVRNVEASQAHPIVVVLGYEAIEVDRVLPRVRHGTVLGAWFRDGLSGSIRDGLAGLSQLPDDYDGALIVLGDMPSVSPSLIDRMINVFEGGDAHAICVASHNGRRGNPVLFARHYFPELLKLEGDTGARRIVEDNPEHVREVEADDDGPLIDIDTPDALEAFRARMP
jgi:molybdenum cofactor cytidylyltransferase